MPTVRTGLVLALSLGAAQPLFPQTVLGSEPDVPEKAGKELRAFRLSGPPPRIDGRLDDAVWALAEAIDDFVQNEPDNMQPPTERTVIQVAYDDRQIYVAARCFMRDVAEMRTGLGRRDFLPPSDLIRISFDPRHDHRTAYTFDTNPSAVQSDYMWYDDTRQSSDYDAVWEVRTSVTAEGWFAEFAIPFSQLRYDAAANEAVVWGFNVRRDVHRRAEFDRWVPTPRGVTGFVSRFGHLTFPEPPAAPRRVELLPYTTMRQEHLVAGPGDLSTGGGLDLRLGLGTAATLSATLNPDFGQVEQDPAVLNLTVFETFFPEKRPFFLEDSRTFAMPYFQFQTFHSRRIGQSPGRLAQRPGERQISRPDQTTILGAAKLTGKAARWTYGGLAALTAAEYATVEPADGVEGPAAGAGVRLERLAEPRTFYGVGRVQRDIFQATSTVGLIGTAVVRDQDLDAFTGGIDYNIRWSRNRYQFDGHWLATHAPARGRARQGFGGLSQFQFNGKHVGVFAESEHFSPGFRNSDLGFLATRVDKSSVRGGMRAGQPDPWKMFRQVLIFFSADQQWNSDRLTFSRSVLTGVDLGFRNFWFVGANTGYNFRVLDDLDTRGGPPIVRPSSRFVNLFVGSDSRRQWRVNLGVNASRDEAGGWQLRIGPNLTAQPSSRIQTQLSTGFTTALTDAQWVRNDDVNGDAVVDHVYGTLRRQVVDITGRATYAFTRDLTAQAFLQPFVAVGDYSNLRRLARPRSYEFEPVALASNPDFNTKSLRSNLVMRWEYRRGSALFLVWNVSTLDASRPGIFSPLSDVRSAFAAEGTHVFMIKANYWLGL